MNPVIPTKKSSFGKAVLTAWLIAGTMDITAAITKYLIEGKQHPERILKYIASGIVGPDAMNRGWDIAFFGLFLHYLVAFLFTIFFFIIYPRLQLQRFNKIVLGILYGAFAWCVMNLVIVPMSNTPKPAAGTPCNYSQAAIQMLILMVCIGIPIAWVANKYYLYKK